VGTGAAVPTKEMDRNMTLPHKNLLTLSPEDLAMLTAAQRKLVSERLKRGLPVDERSVENLTWLERIGGRR
jgi:hypothetical protein